MSDRVLESWRLTSLATLRRIVAALLPAWARQRDATGLDRRGHGHEVDHLALLASNAGTPSGGWWPRRDGSGGIRAWLRAARRRHRSRRQITRLNAHLLRDIGVTYAEAEAEANKPFWRA